MKKQTPIEKLVLLIEEKLYNNDSISKEELMEKAFVLEEQDKAYRDKYNHTKEDVIDAWQDGWMTGMKDTMDMEHGTIDDYDANCYYAKTFKQ